MSDDLMTIRRDDLWELVGNTFDRTPWIHEVDEAVAKLTAGVPQLKLLSVDEAKAIYVARNYSDPREHVSGAPRTWLNGFQDAGLGFIKAADVECQEGDDD